MISISEWLSHQLYSVSKVEDYTTGLFDQIVSHLVKLYMFEDKQNVNHHIHDINNWLKDILKKLQKSKSKISRKKLEKWYDINNLEKIIKSEFIDYENNLSYNYLQRTILTQSEVIQNINDEVREIIYLLSQYNNTNIDKIRIKYINNLKQRINQIY